MHLQNKYSWGSCKNSKHEIQLNKSNLRILSTDWQRVFKVCLSVFASPRLSRGFTIAACELLQQQRAPQPCRDVAYSYVAQLPLARLGEAFGGTSNSLPLDLQPDTSTALF